MNREYSGEYSSARLEARITARLWRQLRRLGSAQIWRAWTPLVFFLRARRMRVGYSSRIFRRRVWATSCSDEADVCTSEFVWMNPTLWNDQNMFLTTLKIQVYPKTLLFSDERGSDTNCWWEKLLVVALKHLEGIKHYQKFAKYQRLYRRNIYVGILRSKLPTTTFRL